MPPTRSKTTLVRYAPLVIALLAVAVCLGALRNGFTFDDLHIVVGNPLVTGEGGLRPIFASHYWAAEDAHGDLYRPLTVASYWLNYRVSGNRPFLYHLVNLLLHGLVTWLVCRLFLRLASNLPDGDRLVSPEVVALAGASFFAVHPVHVEAVVSTVGRAELLAALFVILAWLARGRTWVALPLFVCGLLSKENAVVLPGLLFVEDLFAGKVRQRWRAYLPYVGAIAIFLLVRVMVLGPAIGSVEGPFTSTPAWQRILTATDVLGRYIRLMFWPMHLSADYSYDEIPVITSFAEPRFLAGAATAILAVGLAWSVRRALPLATMGAALFFVALSPVSNFPFGIGVMMAERLLYLPTLGFCLAAGAVSAWVPRLAGRTRAAAMAVLAAVLILFATRSAVRTNDWFDQLTLFEATVRTSPRSALAHVSLGTLYQAAGRIQEAEAAYRRSIAIAPDRPGPHYNLATLLEGLGRRREAIELYREAARIDPDDFRTLNNLGRALVAEGAAAEAVPLLEKAAALRPGMPGPSVNLAAAHLALGDPWNAERILKDVLAAHPDDAGAQRIMSAILSRKQESKSRERL